MSTASFTDKPQKILLLLGVLFFIAALWLILSPLILSTDSLYGFLVYKGSLQTQSFNTLANVSPANITGFDKAFISWWSPGQWMVPASLNYLFGLKLGVASIIITILANFAGLAGYSKLFRYFRFSQFVTALSLLIILCSSTFYYSYFIYQGGEVLEFAIFPWFCLYVAKLEKISFFSLIILILLFVVCFVAKSALLLYCILAISGKIVHFIFNNGSPWKTINKLRNSLSLIFSIVSGITIVYVFYLSRGNNPAADNANLFHAGAMDIFTPLSSPLHSILSVQEWLSRTIQLANRGTAESVAHSLLANILYGCLSIITIFFFIRIYRNALIDKEYKINLLLMYGGVFLFFFISYGLGAKIGYGGRHYKLLGFLSIPALLVILTGWLSNKYLQILIASFVLLAVADFIYLKQKWPAGRYKSINYFYRHYDNLNQKDTLDKATYQQLILLDKQDDHKKNNRVFFIESDNDIAADLKYPCAIELPGYSFLLTKYHGKGPELVICVSKNSFASHPNLLQTKFPDYTSFQLTNETSGYFIFTGKN